MTEVWTTTSSCEDTDTVTRLTGEAPYWHSYRYDEIGNRTKFVERAVTGTTFTSSYSYPAPGAPQPHTVTRIDTSSALGTDSVSYTYDATGNTTSRPDSSGGSQILTWSAEGLLVEVATATRETSFVYDADGNRPIRRDSTGNAALFFGTTEVRTNATGGHRPGAGLLGSSGGCRACGGHREVTRRRQGSHLILALWSMPRSRSTAFFRMMAERGDFHVLHEPFSNIADYGHTEVAGRTVRSAPDLLDAIRRLAYRGPVFFKDTTDKRYPELLADDAFLARDARHTFLIRHPAETIVSFHAQEPDVRSHQIGAEHLHEIHTRTAELTRSGPVVIDAADLVADPPGIVRAYCRQVGIPYLPRALRWTPGHRREWRLSARWHTDVSETTGFIIESRGYGLDVTSHPELSTYLAHHLPFYEDLHRQRLTARPSD